MPLIAGEVSVWSIPGCIVVLRKTGTLESKRTVGDRFSFEVAPIPRERVRASHVDRGPSISALDGPPCIPALGLIVVVADDD
jgi:hypothetical protein